MNAALLDRPRTPQPEWFSSWFDSPHYHTLYAHRDDREAAGFIDSLIARLHPADGARALDLGCGAGRHARQLASQGLNVVGLDLSSHSIQTASRFEHARLRFARHDMRRPFGTNAFDYVFNLFTSFGYFGDPADHLAVVRHVARSLRTGGRLVLDYLNVRYAETHQIRDEVIDRAGARYRVSRWSDARHFFKRIVVDDRRSERPLEPTERVAKFSLHDFQFMLGLYGISLEEAYGDYRLCDYDADASPRLILVGRKD